MWHNEQLFLIFLKIYLNPSNVSVLIFYLLFFLSLIPSLIKGMLSINSPEDWEEEEVAAAAKKPQMGNSCMSNGAFTWFRYKCGASGHSLAIQALNGVRLVVVEKFKHVRHEIRFRFPWWCIFYHYTYYSSV